ncbi:MAG: hypothetical protein VYE04_17385 [Pseudomonadota bacterium]|nr:hypothetical protein [Pseudomonadota bacterium]
MSDLNKSLEADIACWDQLTTTDSADPFAADFPPHRRTGSPGDRATDQWLVAELSSLGLSPTISEYPFNQLNVRSSWIEVGTVRIPAVPMYDTADMQVDFSARAGKDLLILPCAPQDHHPSTSAVLRARSQSHVKAIIAMSSAETVAPGLALVNSESFTKPVHLPVLQVGSENSHMLNSALEKQAPIRCHLHIEREQTVATNVEVRIAGEKPDYAPWIVMTPKSSWWTSTAERIGGIVVWLALARAFSQRSPQHPVIFTANSGHELSHLGMQHFLKTNADWVAGAAGWLHLGANFAARGGRAQLQASAQADLDALVRALAENGIHNCTQTPIGNRPFGEARNVHDQAGRYISIIGSNEWFHHPGDRYPKSVDTEQTARFVQAFVDLGRALI